MPSCKDGTACTLVPPTAPEVAKDADNADPGEVEKVKEAERASKTGKYGSEPAKPYVKPPNEDPPPGSDSSNPPKKKSWISVKLTDADGEPVPGEPYEVKLPDGSVASGTTDANGEARVDGFDPGDCKVTFPKMDKSVVGEG